MGFLDRLKSRSTGQPRSVRPRLDSIVRPSAASVASPLVDEHTLVRGDGRPESVVGDPATTGSGSVQPHGEKTRVVHDGESPAEAGGGDSSASSTHVHVDAVLAGVESPSPPTPTPSPEAAGSIVDEPSSSEVIGTSQLSPANQHERTRSGQSVSLRRAASTPGPSWLDSPQPGTQSGNHSESQPEEHHHRTLREFRWLVATDASTVTDVVDPSDGEVVGPRSALTGSRDRAASLRSDPGAPPEVHITIGEVSVISAPVTKQAPPTKRRPAPAMSLTAYLEQRAKP